MSIFPTAPVGSLLKGVMPSRKPPKKDMGRGHRVKDAEHLDAIRQCMCVACASELTTQAAHIQKKVGPGTGAGIGMKADDKFTCPLCEKCHTRQHSIGETTFWSQLDLDPHEVAESLYKVSPNVEIMRAMTATYHASIVMAKKPKAKKNVG